MWLDQRSAPGQSSGPAAAAAVCGSRYRQVPSSRVMSAVGSAAGVRVESPPQCSAVAAHLRACWTRFRQSASCPRLLYTLPFRPRTPLGPPCGDSAASAHDRRGLSCGERPARAPRRRCAAAPRPRCRPAQAREEAPARRLRARCGSHAAACLRKQLGPAAGTRWHEAALPRVTARRRDTWRQHGAAWERRARVWPPELRPRSS